MATAFSSVASDVRALDDVAASTRELDGLILAAGFEDRAFRLLEVGEFRVGAHCVTECRRSSLGVGHQRHVVAPAWLASVLITSA